jgi:hypothetical protein
MEKVDFKKQLQPLYAPPKKFVLVEVPAMQFLMVDGHGDPNTAQTYQDALEALYAVAYKQKFISKQALAKDYVVPPLEGLWWAEAMDSFTLQRDKTQWDWTMMIMVPDWITTAIFQDAIVQVQRAKSLTALHKLRMETYHEGLSVQIMHIGSYDAEGPVLAQLHQEYLPDHKLIENGKHHEIYLSDPRRVAPEKLKTILRQPVAPVAA